MDPSPPWHTGFDPARPCLLHAGLGRGWWAAGGTLAAADDHRLWVLTGAEARALQLTEVQQVGEADGRLVVTTADRELRLQGDVVEAVDRRPRRAVPGGAAEVWVDAGYAYRRTGAGTRALDVVRPGEQVGVGPQGALLVHGVDRHGAPASRAGAPGRSPRPLPAPVDPATARWSPDGRILAALCDPERPASLVVDLVAGRAEVDARRPRRGRRVPPRGPHLAGPSAPCAAAWSRRAPPSGAPGWPGPGGWDPGPLATGQPVRRRRAPSRSATVGTAAGFVVD
ncbi:MAG: hypothetical protein R3F59_38785 [Myxococcota bacterium]